MKTTNKQIALAPFIVVQEKAKEARGLDMSDSVTNSLISSVAIMDSESYNVGDVLYFRSETSRLPQYRTKYKVNDQEFILIPEDFVVLVKKVEAR